MKKSQKDTLVSEIDEMNERRRSRRRDQREEHIEIDRHLIEPSEGAVVLLNVGRAILARTLFIVHSIATIWQTVQVISTSFANKFVAFPLACNLHML